jgi:hypothetical protein
MAPIQLSAGRRQDHETPQCVSTIWAATSRRSVATKVMRATGACVALVATAAALGVQPARADEPARLEVADEIAGALGFADSHSPGFWEALAQARADERAALEAKAAADRAAAEQARVDRNNEIILDALKNGRRIEEPLTAGEIRFVEIIPPASGDIEGDVTNVRTGTELVASDGTIEKVTRYLDVRNLGVHGTVWSVVEDGVETVTKVVENTPGSIDLKVGDTREVPAPGSSAAGLKPHTFDPKADGSLGNASGNPPAKLEPPSSPAQPIVVRDKTTGGAGGDRLDFEPIPFPDGHVFTPFLESKPPSITEELPHRSGFTIENPAWGDELAQVTIYFDKDGKVAGVVAETIKDGISTIVSVEELIPGSIGLKKGDTRLVPDFGAGKKSTWDPTPSGSSTTTSGKSQPTGSSSSTPSTPSQGPASSDGTRTSTGTPPDGATKEDSTPADNAKSGSSGDDSQPADAGGSGGTDDWHKVDEHDTQNEDGSTTHTVTYRKGEENLFKDVSTKTDAQGNTSAPTTNCYSSGNGNKECPDGMTDEPTCHTGCERLVMLSQVFLCSSGAYVGADCGQAPEGMRPNQSAAPGCDDHPAFRLSTSTSTSSTTSSSSFTKDKPDPDCTSADAPGGPIDYGDPTDPNGAEPADPTQLIRHGDDGVTDPVNPGEPDELVGGSMKLDMYGTLRDPANPPGTEDSAPSNGPPSTGEAEWYERP